MNSFDNSLMNSLEQHRYDFHDAEDYIYKSPKGLSKKVVESISSMKQEPDWMLQFRLKSVGSFPKTPNARLGA